ncbi:MAG: choice-of-anchor J domain-containing protein [Bacteroidales bacterium]
MKKKLPLAIPAMMAFLLLISFNSMGQGSENFDAAGLTTTYADGSFTGDNSIVWNYVHSRDQGDYPIDGNGIMLRRADEPSSLSATFEGGIGDFSVDTRKAFTGNTQRRLELVINGTVVAQFEPTYGDGTDETVIPFVEQAINTPGTIDLELRLYGADGNQQMTLDNISWTGFAGEVTQVATPTFSPNGGTFFAPVDVVISTSTEDATIYHSTQSETGPWEEYTQPINLTQTTTLWAYAEKEAMDDSNVASATFTLPSMTDVANIAALRAGATDGTIYRLTGEAVLTAKDGFNNRKFIQDDTGAIMIFDPQGVIQSTYNIGDGIQGVSGTLSRVNNMLRFIPSSDPGPASSTGNAIVALEQQIPEITPDDQARLVVLENVSFASTGTFENGKNYSITDGTNSMMVRTDFWNVDYIGEPIPTNELNLTGVVIQYNTTMQLVPRDMADITNLYDVTFKVNMHHTDYDPATDEVFLQGDFSDDQPMTPDEADPMVLTKSFVLSEGEYSYKYFMNEAPEWQSTDQRTVMVNRNMTIVDIYGVADIEFPLTEDFEEYADQAAFLANSGWNLIDADEDQNNWFLHSPLTDNQAMASQSTTTSGDLLPENYLVTPPLPIPNLTEHEFVAIDFDVAASDDVNFAETYKVMVSTTGTDAADFTEVIFEDTLTANEADGQFTHRHIKLTGYSGQVIYIAFVHTGSTGQDMLMLDNVEIMVDETPLVYFNVYMHAVQGFDPAEDSVYIGGTMSQWAEPGTSHMLQFMYPSDDDPMIYYTFMRLDKGTYYYKYFIDPGWDGGEWSGEPNREVTIEGDTLIVDVFGSLEDVFTYSATFTIEDQDGNNIENAVVIIDDTAYEPGDYVIDGLESGTYNYMIARIGYTTETGTLTINDDHVSVPVVLQADPNVVIMELPFTEDFEGYTDQDDFTGTSNWMIADVDQDTYNWFLLQQDGNQAMASESVVAGQGSLTPENYLILPALQLPQIQAGEFITMKFDVAASDAVDFEENYQVVISSVGPGADDHYTMLWEETLTQEAADGQYVARTLTLNQFQGQVVYVAIVHTGSTGQDMLLIDNVEVMVEETATHTVTFNVHMHAAEFDPESDVVYITGDMMNWAEPGTDHDNQVMTVVGEDPMVYTIQMELPEGTHEYKYFINSGWQGEEWAGGDNRSIEVTGDMTVDNVFGDPTDDSLPVIEQDLANTSIYPNPAQSNLNVTSDQMIRDIRIINMQGKVIQTFQPESQHYMLNINSLKNGIYLIQVLTDEGSSTHRVIIQK